MTTTSFITTRDSQSWKDVKFIIASDRIMLRKRDNDDEYSVYEPETTTLEEFKERLKSLGELVNLEVYLCPDTLSIITRGWVTKKDGREYFFSVSNPYKDVLWRADVDRTIHMLRLSGREINEA